MTPRKLLESLVYLDTSFVADLYEILTGQSPKTVIAKNQGGKAGANVPFFSAEVSAQETRTFPVSTFQMVKDILLDLEQEPTLDLDDFQPDMNSRYGWIRGGLSVFTVSRSARDRATGENKTLASDALYSIRHDGAKSVALITTPEYFSPGIATFVKLQETLLKDMFIPVRAYVRVFAAKSITDQWVVTPLLILEDESPKKS